MTVEANDQTPSGPWSVTTETAIQLSDNEFLPVRCTTSTLPPYLADLASRLDLQVPDSPHRFPPPLVQRIDPYARAILEGFAVETGAFEALYPADRVPIFSEVIYPIGGLVVRTWVPEPGFRPQVRSISLRSAEGESSEAGRAFINAAIDAAFPVDDDVLTSSARLNAYGSLANHPVALFNSPPQGFTSLGGWFGSGGVVAGLLALYQGQGIVIAGIAVGAGIVLQISEPIISNAAEVADKQSRRVFRLPPRDSRDD